MAAALRRLFHGTQTERARLEPEPPSLPPPSPWGETRRCPQHGDEGKRSVRGSSCGGVSEEQPPFPRYGCQYWNSSPRTSYRSPYPVGPELQGQGIDPSYSNGIYGTPYSAPGTGPPYPTPPPTNAYFSSGHSHAPYTTESANMYRTPPPAASWNYPPPDCPAEGSVVRQQVPGYSPPQAPGFPVPPYPYGDCNHNALPQRPPPPPLPPQPRLQDTTWRSPGVYGIQAPYNWSPSPAGHGNQYFAESSQPWSTSGTCVPPPPPPSNNAKDSYNHLDQGTIQHGYFSEANQMSSGTMNDFKPASLDTKPSASTSKVQYSAQPQLYDNVHKKPSVTDCGSVSKTDLQLQPETLDLQPGIQKVMQVMEGVEQLEEEVDEFVGKKTDKDYCLLEEMLTKKLLELDSIETGGQDNVRQARKEAVNRIQATLEELERKGL